MANITPFQLSEPFFMEGFNQRIQEMNTVTEATQDNLDNVKNIQSDLVSTIATFKGVIVMWSGSVSTIPSGWALCNGDNGTPNLMNRFIVGAGNAYNVGDVGGESKHKLTIDEIPTHNHTATFSGSTDSAGRHEHTLELRMSSTSYNTYNGLKGYQHQYSPGSGTDVVGLANLIPEAASGTTSNGSHTHSLNGNVNIENTGGGKAHNILPPYYALCYIMKL